MDKLLQTQELKHELVNSLAALRSVHTALQLKTNVEEADQLLVSVITKLDRLKSEISKEEGKES